jgi:hypothetical protein
MEGTLAGEPRAPWPILEIAGGGRAAGQWPRLAAETTGKLQGSKPRAAALPSVLTCTPRRLVVPQDIQIYDIVVRARQIN